MSAFKAGLNFRRIVAEIVLAALLPAICSAQVTQGAVQAKNRKVRASGKWSEACPCPVPCPCWRTGRASIPNCLSIYVFTLDHWRIDRQAGRGTFVLISDSEEPFDAPSPKVLYVPESVVGVSDETYSDLIWFAFHIPVVNLKVVKTIIQSETRKRSRRIIVPNVLEVEINRLGLERKPSPEVTQFMFPWLLKPRQWIATKVVYREGPTPIRYSGTNALVADFDIDIKGNFGGTHENKESPAHRNSSIAFSSGLEAHAQSNGSQSGGAAECKHDATYTPGN